MGILEFQVGFGKDENTRLRVRSNLELMSGNETLYTNRLGVCDFVSDYVCQVVPVVPSWVAVATVKRSCTTIAKLGNMEAEGELGEWLEQYLELYN